MLDWAVPFRSPAGRRVLVEGVPAATLTPFLSSFLSQGSDQGRAIYVIDSNRRLVTASKSANLAKGAGLPAALANARNLSVGKTIEGRYVASAPIDGTGWRIVRAQPTSLLYTGVNGARTWLLWVVVGARRRGRRREPHPAAALAGAAAQLREAHTEVRALNATLEAKVAERTELAERRAHALSARMRNSSSSLPSRPTTCRSRCARSACTASASIAGGGDPAEMQDESRAWARRRSACRT